MAAALKGLDKYVKYLYVRDLKKGKVTWIDS